MLALIVIVLPYSVVTHYFMACFITFINTNELFGGDLFYIFQECYFYQSDIELHGRLEKFVKKKLTLIIQFSNDSLKKLLQVPKNYITSYFRVIISTI